MALTTGAMTTRRFRVSGTLDSGWRESLRDGLQKYAFREPPTSMGKEILEGWVRVQNLLETDFSDMNGWLFDPYAVFALRVDKKTLPAKLLRATVEKQCREWCRERGQDTCPSAVKREFKEKLEADWLKRTLPRVSITEVCYNTRTGIVVVDSLSESVADRVRTRFRQSFGLTLVPFSPLDWVNAADREPLMATAPAALGGVL
ncbi:MAG: recombination-associated protein RdgC [Myxococcota bacterium]